VIEKNWQELIRPINPEIEPGRDPERKAIVTAEPLERGFGMTLGNALRRVLLSSLQGSAVSAVQIDGIVHEFTSIPGVREDVTNIVLNLKGLAVRMHVEGPKKLLLRKTGSGPVTGADIEETADVEILNKDHVICTADEGADIRMELTVTTGKGYVAAYCVKWMSLSCLCVLPTVSRMITSFTLVILFRNQKQKCSVHRTLAVNL